MENYGKQVFKLIDRNGDGTIDFREFLINVSIETRGTLDEKLEHVFNLYDLDKNGYVTKSEMVEFIKVYNLPFSNSSLVFILEDMESQYLFTMIFCSFVRL